MIQRSGREAEKRPLSPPTPPCSMAVVGSGVVLPPLQVLLLWAGEDYRARLDGCGKPTVSDAELLGYLIYLCWGGRGLGKANLGMKGPSSSP